MTPPSRAARVLKANERSDPTSAEQDQVRDDGQYDQHCARVTHCAAAPPPYSRARHAHRARTSAKPATGARAGRVRGKRRLERQVWVVGMLSFFASRIGGGLCARRAMLGVAGGASTAAAAAAWWPQEQARRVPRVRHADAKPCWQSGARHRRHRFY